MSEPKEPLHVKRPRGRPRKYDNWYEFNYEYHKMMDNERKKRPSIRAKKSEYQRQYRQKKERRTNVSYRFPSLETKPLNNSLFFFGSLEK